MSIQTTIHIPRAQALARITEVSNYLDEKNYRAIGENAFETYRLDDFFEMESFGDENLDNWTNEMLENVMDRPYYRYSLFENYYVIED